MLSQCDISNYILSRRSKQKKCSCPKNHEVASKENCRIIFAIYIFVISLLFFNCQKGNWLFQGQESQLKLMINAEVVLLGHINKKASTTHRRAILFHSIRQAFKFSHHFCWGWVWRSMEIWYLTRSLHMGTIFLPPHQPLLGVIRYLYTYKWHANLHFLFCDPV